MHVTSEHREKEPLGVHEYTNRGFSLSRASGLQGAARPHVVLKHLHHPWEGGAYRD